MAHDIEKQIQLSAPIERVWKALTDHEEFGKWFRVKLNGPFEKGKSTTGHITHPGFEHLVWKAEIVAMEQPHYFAFTWHPYAVDPKVDYSKEEPTLVEFRLEPSGKGTHLTVIESGFGNVPEHRRAEAMRMNDGGWAQQVKNIKTHVES